MLLYLLAFVSVLANAEELDTSFTSKEKVEYQINAAIRFMCINQYKSNGRFLYTAYLKEDEIEIDPTENNMPRQAGGLYGIAMYYRLNYQNKHKNDEFSITHCIQNSIRYLINMSIPIEFKESIDDKPEIGELIDGNTGATSLAMLGMIEICIIDHKLCRQHLDQFVLWMNGLITMRNYKFEDVDDLIMKNGAFSKKLRKPSESSDFYDGEGYVVFARMLKYQKRLYSIIGDKIKWDIIINIVNGLDEYFIKNQHQVNPHWFVQSWFDRWITFNSYLDSNTNGIINNFQNQYMVSILMKNKMEEEYERIMAHSTYSRKASCYLLEATMDVLYAVKYTINTSKYKTTETMDELKLFQLNLWDKIRTKYAVLTAKQLFKDDVDFYFESRFNGAILSDDPQQNYFRIDDTQHCVCTLMKLNGFLYHTNTNDTQSYYANINELFIDGEAIEMYNNEVSKNYDLMISLICLIVVIVLVNFIFFYWCYYYPKEQKQRNDLIWMEKTILSEKSDFGDYTDEDTEFIPA